ncbi:membrane protein insertion efficiency factor YidD [Myxococcota bacterium]|nr:membrane protein insertion efficiency factor YidD [Myxococcota bacterium]
MLLLNGYQRVLSPYLGPNCRFIPTCSEYAKVAIMKYGAFKGLWLTAKRLLRCHPFCSGGYDPVPAQSKKWQIGDSS